MNTDNVVVTWVLRGGTQVTGPEALLKQVGARPPAKRGRPKHAATENQENDE